MLTLIVRSGDLVRFLVTNHPGYRFNKLVDQMPCFIAMFGVTAVKAKDIKLRFAGNLSHGEWYHLDDNLEQFLSSVVEN
jgi:hypothetical protein